MLHSSVRWRGLAAFAAVIALAVGVGQTSVGHAVLRKAGLFAEPTGYTSLAFLHPQSLPEQLGSKPTSVSISFVIHNARGAPSEYLWSVLLVQGQLTQRVAAGTVRVASGRGATITRSATILCTQPQVRIVVSL